MKNGIGGYFLGWTEPKVSARTYLSAVEKSVGLLLLNVEDGIILLEEKRSLGDGHTLACTHN